MNEFIESIKKANDSIMKFPHITANKLIKKHLFNTNEIQGRIIEKKCKGIVEHLKGSSFMEVESIQDVSITK